MEGSPPDEGEVFLVERPTRSDDAVDIDELTIGFDIDPRALVVGVAAQIQNIKAVHAYHASGGKF